MSEKLECSLNTKSFLQNNNNLDNNESTLSKYQSKKRFAWTLEEDHCLQFLVDHYFVDEQIDWNYIANKMKTFYNEQKIKNSRSAKQCRERWFNYLKNNSKNNDCWKPEEENLLCVKVKEEGYIWSEHVKHFTNKNSNTLKCHYYSILRRKIRTFYKSIKKEAKIVESNINFEDLLKEVTIDDIYQNLRKSNLTYLDIHKLDVFNAIYSILINKKVKETSLNKIKNFYESISNQTTEKLNQININSTYCENTNINQINKQTKKTNTKIVKSNFDLALNSDNNLLYDENLITNSKYQMNEINFESCYITPCTLGQNFSNTSDILKYKLSFFSNCYSVPDVELLRKKLKIDINSYIFRQNEFTNYFNNSKFLQSFNDCKLSFADQLKLTRKMSNNILEEKSEAKEYNKEFIKNDNNYDKLWLDVLNNKNSENCFLNNIADFNYDCILKPTSEIEISQFNIKNDYINSANNETIYINTSNNENKYFLKQIFDIKIEKSNNSKKIENKKRSHDRLDCFNELCNVYSLFPISLKN